MPAANRLLIQVVPKLTPGRCGVSDQAVLIAHELKRAFTIDTAFFILNSNEKCDVPQIAIHCPPSQLLAECLKLTEGRPGTLLVHLSGYGYSADGAPTLLADALEGVRASGKFRTAVYFHELYASGMPWKKAFWYSSRQRRTIRKIAELSDLLVTSTHHHADWLQSVSSRRCKAPIQLLPVISAAGETLDPAPFSSREPALAVFGLPGSRQRAYRELANAGSMLGSLGIEEIYDVGPDCDVPSALGAIPVKRLGGQAPEHLADLFSRLRFGFVPHAAKYLAKSSIFASYCAQGTIPLLIEPFSGEVDGLRDGVQVVSSQSVKNAMASELECCSRAAWNWYSGHRLHVHAATYSQWIDQLPGDHVETGEPAKSANISNKERPLTVAICIGTFNQSQYLRDSIASALAQTYPIQEIWVSDDASTDDTDAIMHEIIDRYPRIRYFRQPANLGLPGNISWLLSQPQTDLIVRLDSDDRLEPEYVAVLSKLMQQYPKAGYAHCNVTEIDREGHRTRIRRLLRTNSYESAEQALKGNASGYRVAANCILYRAEAIKEVDYYRPTLSWRYCEDWDMTVRLAIAGWGNAYAPQTLSNYRVWDDGKGVRASRKFAEARESAEIYKTRLIPEYMKRGWSIVPLKKHMRSRAVGFASSLDSPRFTEDDRKEYKRLLKNLGESPQLSLTIFLVEAGFAPLLRFMHASKFKMKGALKRLLRKQRA